MKTAPTHQLGLIFALHPTAKGFGWVLFESPLSPIDWGIASARAGRSTRLIARFERLLKRYEPATLVLEAYEGRSGSRVDRIQKLCRNMQHLAACQGIETRIYERSAIRMCFAPAGATTRYEIALAIAQRIDAFSHRLPRERARWMNEDPRQSLFDAAALAMTYFGLLSDTQL